MNALDRESNFSSMREELDLLEENRELAALNELAAKQRIAASHGKKVVRQ